MGLISFLLMQLLAAYTVLVEPFVRTNFYRRLKKSLPAEASARLLYYRTQVLWEWSWVVVLAVILIPVRQPLAWLGLNLPNWIGWVILLALLAGVVLSIVLLRRSSTALEKMRKSLESSAAILPTTPVERRWFAAVAITAGLCEELLYRGFLIRYMLTAFPGLDWLVSSVLSGLIYGLSHAYQGRRGLLQTALNGFSFAIVFCTSAGLICVIYFTIGAVGLTGTVEPTLIGKCP